jgi:nanoRNase/pAp phosphatase (c-di-AMP/oligoRNAs hydrolase)
MSFIPQSVLNMKYAQISIPASTISIVGGTPQLISLSSISTNSSNVSLSGNNIVLQGGVDYFIITSVAYRHSSTSYPLTANGSAIVKFGIFNVTDNTWPTQKTSWPVANNLSNINYGLGGHSPQAMCVIPSFSGSKQFQLKIKSSPTGTTTMYITNNNATVATSDSAIIIYHN